MDTTIRELSYSQAIQEAMAIAMERDERVFLMGEDIGVYGGAFQVTGDLVHRFGEDRVMDTPISELGGAGVAVGAALTGMRPIFEFQFSDFAALAMEQIVNQAAKIRYMLGGAVSVPLVMRFPAGSGTGAAAQHSQSIEAWLGHVPGLKVVQPSTPYDMKGMLLAAVEDPDPVMIFEHKLLYKMKGEVPEGYYTVPLNKAKVVREGTDLTIVASAIMVHKALDAAAELAKEGINVEVIDLRSVRPIDRETIIASVKKTSKLMCVYEAVKTLGIGAEISALVAESDAFDYLDAPIIRLGGAETPIPYNPDLERATVPQVPDILKSARELVKGGALVMAVEVILPKVDMDMETGQISRWYAKDGDTVTKGQLLFEIETDKAAMEVDAPASGILGDVSAAEGAVVPVGQAVAWIYAEGEERKVVSQPVAEPVDEPHVQPSVSETPAVQPVITSVPVAQTEITGIRATPLARRLAKDAGLDLNAVQGSGPKGRIQKKDIEFSLAVAAPAVSPVQVTVSRPVVTSPAQGALNAVWLRQGERGQLPIVLIHGFASDLNSWRMLLAGGTLRNPVLALDLPAHGGSPRYVPESIDAIAASVETTLAAHGVEACILVGHSMGGAVAAVTADRGIADVRSLVLISSAGLGPQINGAFLNGLVQAKSEASIVPWLKELFADENMLSRAFINATVVQAQDTELRAAQAGMAAHLCADSTQTFEIRSSLEGLAIPVRLIFGAQDRIIPVAHAHGLPGDVGVHVFRNCGHMPQLEQRDAVLRIIGECSRAAQ